MSLQRLSLFALLALAFASDASAAHVDAVRAADTAARWVARARASSRAPTGEVRTFSVGGTNLFHLVGISRGGFAAVAAGEGDMPVVGFTEHGALPDGDDGSPLWDIIAAAAGHGAPSAPGGARPRTGAAANRTRFDVSSSVVPVKRMKSGAGEGYLEQASLLDDVRVAPLIGSRWDQKYAGGVTCYNYYTTNNWPCGCVATAMAQVMRYHSWPQTPVAPLARTCGVGETISNKAVIPESMVDISTMGGDYSWQDMPLVPDQAALTAAQRQAIGKICHDAGVTVGMWYHGATLSDAYVEFAHGPLRDTFGYPGAVSLFCIETEGVMLTADEIECTLLPNFDAGYPCIVGIGGSGIGSNGCQHAVVGDGYGYSGGDLYCHYECGWSGDHDFWFLVPDNTHIYNCGFKVYSVSYNIFPGVDGSLVTGRVLDASGNAVAGAVVTAAVEERGTVTFTTNVVASANGIYAVMAPGRDCTVRISAENGGKASQTNEIDVCACESVEIFDYFDWGCDGDNVCGNSWGNTLVIGGFRAGDEVPLAGGATATLTAGQAAWLNSLGMREAVADSLANVAASDFATAFLLNLDVTDPEWRKWSFRCESVSARREGDDTAVAVEVCLDRGGRFAPLNGTLSLYSVDLATGAEERIGNASVDDALFEHGEVATVEFRVSSGCIAVKAVVHDKLP